MTKKSKSLLAVFLVFMLFIQSAIVVNVSAVEEDIYKKMVSIANNEVGYVETTYSDGTFSSKYGEWYGIPKGAWCAMFVSWCANQAGISTESIPKFASCSVGIQWFQNKGLWKEKSGYTPSVGDIVFLHQGTHVGIVDSFKNGVLGTVEGNASDENGENFAVRKKFYSSSSSDITGYGIPDKTIMSKINGKAIQKQTAYMLPNASSQTVWEIWKDDDLQVICKDGSYYLVMYPFLSTGKFVCAYVPVSTVSTSADIPNATNFYLNQKATVKANSDIYHNPSDGSLLSNSGEDKKVRATVTTGENCQILFADGDYYFIKTDSNLTGFIKQANLTTKSNIIESGSSNICGDVDNNGKVGLSDAIALSRYLLGRMTSSQIQLSAADTNKDGNVDIKDVVIIQRYLLGYIERLPNVPTVEVEEIWLPSSMELKVNETRSVAYSVIPDNATDKTLSWTSKNTSIATVSNTGTITGKGVGTTQIIATANNGVQKGITVNVVRNYVDVTGISINNVNPAPVYSGTNISLGATVSPSDATDKSVTWTSSNPDVASVDSNGNVTTKSAGTVTITATSSNQSVKATSTVKVNQLVSYIENGNYTLKLKGTNMYLDHQGGSANGTNVHLWEGDGQSNSNQKIRTERIDDNRYKLWSLSNSKFMIDVNRGSSYSDPLKIGLNVDLWENNDWQAQEWLFTKTYDGYYILRLNMLQEGALEAAGKSNGANIFYGTYNCDNDMQKWELVGTNIIETQGQIYNTEDIGNVHVRSGPGSNYPSIGGFNEGQIITVIGDTSATWLKVRGANRHNKSEIIEGYTHRDYIIIPPPPIDDLAKKFRELQTRFVHGQYWNGYNASDYSHTGTIPCNCSRTCTGNCSCRCGQFYYNGQWVAAQCHGYALRLGYEIYGNNPAQWAREYTLDNVRPGDIIRYLNNGHTVMVTGVSGNTITFTDCNYIGPCKVRWNAQMTKSQFTGFSYVLKHP